MKACAKSGKFALDLIKADNLGCIFYRILNYAGFEILNYISCNKSGNKCEMCYSDFYLKETTCASMLT